VGEKRPTCHAWHTRRFLFLRKNVIKFYTSAFQPYKQLFCYNTKKTLFLLQNRNKMNLKRFIILLSCVCCTLFTYAQEHKHEHFRNEIGFSGGALYAFRHHEWGTGLHVHYFRTLWLHSKWAFGGGFEQAWIDGNHFNVGAGMKYQLIDRLSISALPGVSFISHKKADTHQPRKTLFTLHFELVYDIFHWENFHLGTVLDYSWGKSDPHAMIGIHAAFCF
jgi:hypothetical protein